MSRRWRIVCSGAGLVVCAGALWRGDDWLSHRHVRDARVCNTTRQIAQALWESKKTQKALSIFGAIWCGHARSKSELKNATLEHWSTITLMGSTGSTRHDENEKAAKFEFNVFEVRFALFFHWFQSSGLLFLSRVDLQHVWTFKN
eukprot:jgi/Bigna1/78019/fgenesh1_pg.52_\